MVNLCVIISFFCCGNGHFGEDWGFDEASPVSPTDKLSLVLTIILAAIILKEKNKAFDFNWGNFDDNWCDFDWDGEG